MNFSIVPAAFDFLRFGGVVADPKLWKKGGEALNAAIVAAALGINPVMKGLGYEFQIPEPVAYGGAAVLVWLVGLFFTAATSDKFGLLPAKRNDEGARELDPRPGVVVAPVEPGARGGATERSAPDTVRRVSEADREAP